MKDCFYLFSTLLKRLLLVEVLFILCKLSFFLYNLAFFTEITFSRLFELSIIGLRFDIAVILLINIPLIFFSLIPFDFRFTKSYVMVLKLIFYIVNALALLVNCLDTIYYRFTLERTTLHVISQFKDETNWMELMAYFLMDYWYALVFWIMLVLILVTVDRKIKDQFYKPKNSQQLKFISLFLFPFIIYGIIIGARGSMSQKNNLSVQSAVDIACKPIETVLIINTPFSILYPKNSKEELISFYSSRHDLNEHFNPLHQNKDLSAFIKKNVVIIILESFSREFVGFYNHELENGTYKGFTPFLDSLIKESMSFKYSIANGRKSIEAMPSVLCSIPSLQIPHVLSPYAENKINSLAGLLHTEGYHSSFFHGGSNGSMGFQKFAATCGFDQYYGRNEYNNDEDYDGTWGIWDEKFLQFTAKKIASFKEPFLATVFTVTSHYPYSIPIEYRDKFKSYDKGMSRSIAYSDYSLKQFFKAMSHLPSFKNTLFVITADHAASVINHSEYFSAMGYFEIPILFYTPDKSLVGYSDGMIQQVDIMPTVLNHLHYQWPYVAFGNDVFDKEQNGMAVNYYENSYCAYYKNYLLRFDGTRSTALYEFGNDKALNDNLLKKRPEIVHQIEPKLKAFIQQYKNRMITDSLTTSTTLPE